MSINDLSIRVIENDLLRWHRDLQDFAVPRADKATQLRHRNQRLLNTSGDGYRAYTLTPRQTAVVENLLETSERLLEIVNKLRRDAELTINLPNQRKIDSSIAYLDPDNK
jgi:hypothetical protein